ncbi:MAG: uroporphyrinogen decarboxylase family protein [Candidatus Kariarchaeaceae archaeon]|jgi:uroporphyrinogen decarboxylase
MTFDSVLSVLRGEITAEPLISLWRHYPEVDLQVEGLIEATIADYKRFPSDLLKLSPHGRYCCVDFGCEITPGSTEHGETGACSCKKCVVVNPSDWQSIEEIDPLDGFYGELLKYVEKVAETFPNTPNMMTIFSPTMVARKLSRNLMPEHYFDREHTHMVREALKIITKVTTEFAQTCLDAGSTGLFIAVQEADRSLLNDKQMISDLIGLNRPFMNAISHKSQFTVLHIHGKDILFEEAIKQLKPTAVNWHDQTVKPDLSEGHILFKGGLLGGLEPDDVLDDNISEPIQRAKELRETIPLILAPGCVLLQGTTDAVIMKIFEKYRN